MSTPSEGGGSAKSRQLRTRGGGGSAKCECLHWKKCLHFHFFYFLEIISVQDKFNIVHYTKLLSAIHELAEFSNLIMNLLYNSWKSNNSITQERSNVNHPLEFCMMLSYLKLYKFRGTFILFLSCLVLFVLLFIFILLN